MFVGSTGYSLKELRKVLEKKNHGSSDCSRAYVVDILFCEAVKVILII